MEILDDMMLIGTNRRCDSSARELRLQFSAGEIEALARSLPDLSDRLAARLAEEGVFLADAAAPAEALPAAPQDAYADLLGRTALALQQRAGHRVDFSAVVPSPLEHCSCAVFEYEHGDAGVDAGRLALQLLNDLLPEVGLAEPPIAEYRGFTVHLRQMVRQAPGQLLPRDTQAIIDAATRLDIPCVKLEREPYEGLSGAFRVRVNGLLKLGHAGHQRVVDGTFCIDSGEAVAALLHDREAVRRVLTDAGAPLPARESAAPVSITARRAVRAAAGLGYPVVIKGRALARAGHGSVRLGLNDAESVRGAAEQILRGSPGVLVESQAPGETCKVLLANGEILAVLAVRDGLAVADVTEKAHPEVGEWARRLWERLKPALLTLTVVTPDISRPLTEAGRVVNMNVAPELDGFLSAEAFPPAAGLLERAAEGLVRYLFPEGSPARIPLIAVTGTNGKTTVCGLVARVMQRAGYQVGRAGTTGLFLNDERLEFADMSGGHGHHKVLESPEVDFGVLETARGAVTSRGLMFDRCDISVCTNVTNDHLHERGVHSVPEMAELKEFIVQRASEAVVLNADNAYSIGMLPRLAGRQAWITSSELSLPELLEKYGADAHYCFAEPIEGVEWVSLHRDGQSAPVMPVSEIPISFGGRVRFNVSNALQAIAACRQAGASIADIRAAVPSFAPDIEDNPGRLNLFEGLPFTVLFDFAHNRDGFAQLANFADRLGIAGRKIFVFASMGRDADEEVIERAGCVAGLFDLYVCRNYPVLYGREPEELPALMKQGLMAQGVPESAIVVAPGDDAIQIALGLCEPGDLLVFTASARTLHQEWEEITAYQPPAGSA